MCLCILHISYLTVTIMRKIPLFVVNTSVYLTSSRLQHTWPYQPWQGHTKKTQLLCGLRVTVEAATQNRPACKNANCPPIARVGGWVGGWWLGDMNPWPEYFSTLSDIVYRSTPLCNKAHSSYKTHCLVFIRSSDSLAQTREKCCNAGITENSTMDYLFGKRKFRSYHSLHLCGGQFSNSTPWVSRMELGSDVASTGSLTLCATPIALFGWFWWHGFVLHPRFS